MKPSKGLSLEDLVLDLGPPAKLLTLGVNNVKPKLKHRIRWQPDALILVLQQTLCACGETYLTPASDLPLVRFRHPNGKLWEVAEHPAMHRPQLKRETRVISRRVHQCQKCWSQNLEHLAHGDLFMSAEAFEVMGILLKS